jgi:hypothetical protein
MPKADVLFKESMLRFRDNGNTTTKDAVIHRLLLEKSFVSKPADLAISASESPIIMKYDTETPKDFKTTARSKTKAIAGLIFLQTRLMEAVRGGLMVHAAKTNRYCPHIDSNTAITNKIVPGMYPTLANTDGIARIPAPIIVLLMLTQELKNDARASGAFGINGDEESIKGKTIYISFTMP